MHARGLRFAMRRMSLRFLLCGLALLLHCAGVGLSAKVPLHVCHFDEIHKHDDGKLPEVHTLTQEEAKGLPTDSVVGDTKNIRAIRFHLSLQDLRRPTKYCKTVNSKRADVLGNEITCNQDNILTVEKKRDLVHIVHSAMKLHSVRLNVKTRVEHGFKVPEFANAFCKRFTVPADHRQKGVANADIALYVSSFPSLADNLFAASAPCAKFSDGRPVAGVLTYATRRIQPTMYNVRVAAHEIAHTMGFAYNVMKNITSLNMLENQVFNGKRHITRVGGREVGRYIKHHYRCQSGVTQMELEDEAGVLTVPSRSHWERRVALEDLMAGIVTAGLYTELTLSLFQDMGFFTLAPYDPELMWWGRDAGCDFLQKPCIENGVSKYPQMFCTSESNDTTKSFCAPGRRAMGKCSGTVTNMFVLKQHQYFGDKRTGHKELLTDRCPVVEEYEELSCTDSTKGTEATGFKDIESVCMVGCEVQRRKCSNVKERATCGKATVFKRTSVKVQMQLEALPMSCGGKDYRYTFISHDDQKYRCTTRYDINYAKQMQQKLDDEKNLSIERDELITEAVTETGNSTTVAKPRPVESATAAPSIGVALLVLFFGTALL